MTQPLTITQPHPAVARDRELAALRGRISDAWYGGARPAPPHGRRYWNHGTVRFLTRDHAPLPPLPEPAAGQDALRQVLRDWRTEYRALAAWDDEQGGAARRALVAAGVLLGGEPTEDARERADALVRDALAPAVRARREAGEAPGRARAAAVVVGGRGPLRRLRAGKPSDPDPAGDRLQ